MIAKELLPDGSAMRRYLVALSKGPKLDLDPHRRAPDQADLDEVGRWVRRARRPTAIDLFSGAGGLSLGLRDAGFSVLVAADNDPNAIRTHRHNLGGLGYQGDLSDPSDFLEHLDAWGVRQVDLIAGGVPCQPFSVAGKSKIRSLVASGIRPARDPRADLWRSFMAIIRAVRPRAVLMENVPGLAEWEDGAVVVGFCEDLEALGYRVDAAILEAHKFRVPQHRSRLFIVGVDPRLSFRWPRPRPWHAPTLRHAIGDLPTIDGGHRLDPTPYVPSAPASPLARRLRRDVPKTDRFLVRDHISRSVRADDLEAFSLMQQGSTYKDLPQHLRRYRSDIFTDKYHRLSWDGLSRTITAHIARDGYWYIHPEQHRTLSIREAARVQTFPDWFRFSGEPSHRYRLIGNAVPPLLAEAIGNELRRALAFRPRKSATRREPFRTALMAWHQEHSRDFPWRRGLSPWLVLLAEMCLHRTRASQAATVFRSLRRLAPTPPALLRNEEAARRTMASLGLRWRVDNIFAVARVLIDVHHGRIPDTRSDLLMLPGVGDYVANAVLVFGFGRSAVLMDTNTQRIAQRYTGRKDARPWQLRMDLNRLAGPGGPGAQFNFALLDLGALVCRAPKPDCAICPLRLTCASRKDFT